MQVTLERVGDLFLTVRENNGEKFYNLEDILQQIKKLPCPLDKIQKPVKLNCNVIFGYRFDGTNFIQSVFVDETGLKDIVQTKEC